jgi:hypothetical protein
MLELCRSHGWITLGNDMTTLSIIDIITTPFRYGEKPHRNVPVLSFLNSENSDMVIRVSVYKYYPVSAGEILSNKADAFNVLVLPGMTEGLCSLQRSTDKWDAESLKRYWKLHHGYDLTAASVSQTVGVSLPASGSELTYPITCVWKHKWNYLPSHTREYLPAIESRLSHEVHRIVGLWSQALSIDITVLRDGNMWINQHASQRCHPGNMKTNSMQGETIYKRKRR